MELRQAEIFYIIAGLCVIFFIVSFIVFKRKSKYGGGKKAVVPDYLRQIPYYKAKYTLYRFLRIVLIGVIIASLLITGLLAARPYKTESKEVPHYNRDIILCMDISTTVDNLNQELIDKLIDVVEQLNGERFGIVIFNTSPLLLCPLTNDYEYVVDILEKVKEGLQLRIKYYDGDYVDYDRLYELDAYISDGTLVGNAERGSSIIGDGLASACMSFPDVEENPDRSRTIIFTTDNDLQGEELITLPQAGQMCKDNGIIVYGIGTEVMDPDQKQMMEDTVIFTGGEFFYGEDPVVVEGIVDDISEQVATLDETHYEIIETDVPETPFKFLLAAIIAMILLAFILKV
ncbi:MAG: hypothetical protein K5745_01255 [Saccharofermentans sp.]|nr:hypothetical protein [Saccharofermentans sp.]